MLGRPIRTIVELLPLNGGPQVLRVVGGATTTLEHVEPFSTAANALSEYAGVYTNPELGNGRIVLAVSDQLDANLELSTSAVFATEFSLRVENLPGQEPNKRATAQIGEGKADIFVESRRGEIRLLRWTGFTTVNGKPVDEDEQADTDSD